MAIAPTNLIISWITEQRTRIPQLDATLMMHINWWRINNDVRIPLSGSLFQGMKLRRKVHLYMNGAVSISIQKRPSFPYDLWIFPVGVLGSV